EVVEATETAEVSLDSGAPESPFSSAVDLGSNADVELPPAASENLAADLPLEEVSAGSTEGAALAGAAGGGPSGGGRGAARGGWAGLWEGGVGGWGGDRGGGRGGGVGAGSRLQPSGVVAESGIDLGDMPEPAAEAEADAVDLGAAESLPPEETVAAGEEAVAE